MHAVLPISCSCVLGVCCFKAEPCMALRRHIWGCNETDAKPCPLRKSSLPAGATTTRFLESLPFSPHAIEVVSPGMNTTVQACHSTILDLRHCTFVPTSLLRCCASQHTVKLESISYAITGRVSVILKIQIPSLCVCLMRC